MRLIDADALYKTALESLDENPHTLPSDRAMHKHEHKLFLTMIDSMPAIDAEPVRHGTWEERMDGRYGQRRTYCSACGRHSGIGGNKQEPPYCPNCGAKMDGGGE